MTDRRKNVPFDPHYFEKQSGEGSMLSAEDTFRHIYEKNHWSGERSVSGEGASSVQTRQLRQALPALMEELEVDVLLDLPCGDFSWMQSIELPVSTYIGGDIVPELVARNRERYAEPGRRFERLDVTRDRLPPADLLLCRDGLVHLSFGDIHRALANIRRSDITYLLATTFPECEENEDITTGDWRILNMERPPFNLPAPLRLINERCTEGGGQFRDKSLGLWVVAE